MVEPHYLRNAPISEALIDIRARPGTPGVGLDYEAIKRAVAASYPNSAPMHYGQANISLGSPPQASISTKDLGIQGYLFKSSDGKEVLQFRQDGFTFNRLKPYTEWDDIYPRALKMWSQYASLVRPQAAIRLALRYINHVAVPSSFERFEELMVSPPSLPNELPQYMSEFLTRIVLHDPERELTGIVVQSFQGDPGGKHTLVLDIDVFKAGEFEPVAEAFDETFQALRAFKNKIFFSSLTAEQIGRFEE